MRDGTIPLRERNENSRSNTGSDRIGSDRAGRNTQHPPQRAWSGPEAPHAPRLWRVRTARCGDGVEKRTARNPFFCRWHTVGPDVRWLASCKFFDRGVNEPTTMDWFRSTETEQQESSSVRGSINTYINTYLHSYEHKYMHAWTDMSLQTIVLYTLSTKTGCESCQIDRFHDRHRSCRRSEKARTEANE